MTKILLKMLLVAVGIIGLTLLTAMALVGLAPYRHDAGLWLWPFGSAIAAIAGFVTLGRMWDKPWSAH